MFSFNYGYLTSKWLTPKTFVEWSVFLFVRKLWSWLVGATATWLLLNVHWRSHMANMSEPPDSGMFAQRGKLCVSSNWLGRAETPFFWSLLFLSKLFLCIFWDGAQGHEVCLLLSIVPESQTKPFKGGISWVCGDWGCHNSHFKTKLYLTPLKRIVGRKINCCIPTAHHYVYIESVKLLNLRIYYLLFYDITPGLEWPNGKVFLHCQCKKRIYLNFKNFVVFVIRHHTSNQNKTMTQISRFDQNCGESELLYPYCFIFEQNKYMAFCKKFFSIYNFYFISL